jgi:Zn ribbon nucleic-acid-binding protein
MDALARLVAIEEIKQLKARYFRLLDTRDFDGMAMVFCKDAVFDCTEGGLILPLDGPSIGAAGPVKRGRDEIMAWIRESFAQRTCVHHGHCHEITIDSETEAHGVIAMEDLIQAADRKTRVVHAAGHYHERYRVEDGQWRIAATKLTRLYRATPAA